MTLIDMDADIADRAIDLELHRQAAVLPTAVPQPTNLLMPWMTGIGRHVHIRGQARMAAIGAGRPLPD